LYRKLFLKGSTMKRVLLAATLLLPVLASAATLETVVESFALPAKASYSANDWAGTNAISGVQWQHKGLKETPVSPFTRLGTIKLDGLPLATLFFSGARTMVTQLNVMVGGNGAPVIEKQDFNAAMRTQFRTARIRQLRGGCKNEGGVAGSAVYEVTLSARKPVYLMLATDAGGSTPDSRTTSFEFQLEPQERWACTS
jgi:opacity protein-like surface antigen